MTLTEAKKRFLRHCRLAVSLSENTLRAYAGDLDDALRHLGRRGKLESIRLPGKFTDKTTVSIPPIRGLSEDVVWLPSYSFLSILNTRTY